MLDLFDQLNISKLAGSKMADERIRDSESTRNTVVCAAERLFAEPANRPLNVRAEMRRLMKYIGGNPMMLRLAARTRLEGDHQAWPGEPAVLDMLTRRITLSQKRGLIREDVSPEHLSIMLMGIV